MYREIRQGSKYASLLKKRADLQPGSAHLATRFVDFDCEPESFGSVLRAVAEQRGLKVTVMVFETAVVYAFFDPNGYLMPYLKNYPVVKKMRRGQ